PLEVGVARRVAGRFPAQELQHLGRERARIHERLEDGLAQGVERAVGLVLAELAPERVGVRASGEARLEEEIGELIEQGLEVDGVGQLGQVATVRGVSHRLPTPNIGPRRAFPQWTKARFASERSPIATSASSFLARVSRSLVPGCNRWRSGGWCSRSPTLRSPLD